MRVGRQLLWWRPWTTTAANKRTTGDEKHRHHIECQHQQELSMWPLHVLWHVTQALRGLHEHLDFCKEISTPYSWRDTFVEGFPLRLQIIHDFSLKIPSEKSPHTTCQLLQFPTQWWTESLCGCPSWWKTWKCHTFSLIDCHNTLVFFLKNMKYNSLGLYLLSSSC